MSAGTPPISSKVFMPPPLRREFSMSAKKYSIEAAKHTKIGELNAYIQEQIPTRQSQVNLESNLVKTSSVSEHYTDYFLVEILGTNRETMGYIQVARYERDRDDCDPCGAASQSSTY